MDPDLYVVKCIIILSSEGDRLFAKYYDRKLCSIAHQRQFEKKLFKRSQMNVEIDVIDGLVASYRKIDDFYVFVIGACDGNELMLATFMNCLSDVLLGLLNRFGRAKDTLLKHYDMLQIVVDEMCDNGIVLSVEKKTLMKLIELAADDKDLYIGKHLEIAKHHFTMTVTQ